MTHLKRILPVAGLLLLPFCFHWKLFAWNPGERTVLEGLAHHAGSNLGSLYPPHYLLLPFRDDGPAGLLALEGYQLLHQGLAGLGMWLFLGWLGSRAGAAWLGACVFMFTGFFAPTGRTAVVLTASWIPLNLYWTGRATESDRARKVVVLAAGMAMMVLAGHPSTALCGIVLTTAWALVKGGWRKTLRRLAPALVPALVLVAVRLTSSSQGPDAEALGPLPSFLDLYTGMGGLLLAVFGFIASPDRLRWFFAGLAAVSLLLALVPVSFAVLGIYGLGMAVLSAYGMDGLLSGERRRLAWVVKGAFTLCFALAAGSAILHTRLLVSPGELEPQQVEALVSTVNWALVLAAVNGLILLAVLWRSGRRWPAWALGALLVIDLGSFVKDRGQIPYRSSTVDADQETRAR